MRTRWILASLLLVSVLGAVLLIYREAQKPEMALNSGYEKTTAARVWQAADVPRDASFDLARTRVLQATEGEAGAWKLVREVGGARLGDTYHDHGFLFKDDSILYLTSYVGEGGGLIVDAARVDMNVWDY